MGLDGRRAHDEPARDRRAAQAVGGELGGPRARAGSAARARGRRGGARGSAPISRPAALNASTQRVVRHAPLEPAERDDAQIVVVGGEQRQRRSPSARRSRSAASISGAARLVGEVGGDHRPALLPRAPRRALPGPEIAISALDDLVAGDVEDPPRARQRGTAIAPTSASHSHSDAIGRAQRLRGAPQQVDEALVEGLPVAQRPRDLGARAQQALAAPLAADVLDRADPPHGPVLVVADEPAARLHLGDRAVGAHHPVVVGHDPVGVRLGLLLHGPQQLAERRAVLRMDEVEDGVRGPRVVVGLDVEDAEEPLGPDHPARRQVEVPRPEPTELLGDGEQPVRRLGVWGAEPRPGHARTLPLIAEPRGDAPPDLRAPVLLKEVPRPLDDLRGGRPDGRRERPRRHARGGSGRRRPTARASRGRPRAARRACGVPPRRPARRARAG